MQNDQKLGRQSIRCSVDSCRFHENGGTCGLDGIQVAATHGGSTGRPEDESNCASYKTCH